MKKVFDVSLIKKIYSQIKRICPIQYKHQTCLRLQFNKLLVKLCV